MTQSPSAQVRIDLRDKLKFNERLSGLLTNDSSSVVVIGISEADDILKKFEQMDSLTALNEVEFSVKR